MKKWSPEKLSILSYDAIELNERYDMRIQKTVSVRTRERNRPSFVNISPTVVIDTSMDRSS